MIHIATACDTGYLPYLGTMLYSATVNCSKPITAHILLRDATVDMAQYALRNIKQLPSLRYYCIHNPCDDVNVRLSGHISRATMDRLMLPSLLRGINRVVYLDIDILVLGDLHELFHFSTGPRGICARPSHCELFSTVFSSMRAWGHANIKEAHQYIGHDWNSFNGGVMVLDLERLRLNQFEDSCLRLVRCLGVNDQLACTIYAQNEFAVLDRSWNLVANADPINLEDAKILHWISDRKPWMRDTPLADIWLEYKQSAAEGPLCRMRQALRPLLSAGS